MRLSTSLFLLLASLATYAGNSSYPLHYRVTLNPEQDRAEVVIESDHKGLLKVLDFNLDPERHTDIQANGKLELKDGRAVWYPPKRKARLTLNAKISHQRDPGEYDALMTDDWAIFRGDDLVPPARVVTAPDARSQARLTFALPEHWASVNTGWEKLDDRTFAIEDPERRFSRPTGWMIAGRLGTRRDQLGNTRVLVSAPRGSGLRRMDVLTFMAIVWPQMEAAFGEVPPKLALIGHGEPMWRGGLSASNSLFLHADRPLVSENGTSSLVHELVHLVTRVYGQENHDWISEGLAEFYSFELLHRAGAMTDRRRQKVLDDLTDWSQAVDTLIQPSSRGATTARAVLIFEALDREIRAATDGQRNLDHLVRRLMPLRKVSLEDLRRLANELAGKPLKSLQNPVLDAAE